MPAAGDPSRIRPGFEITISMISAPVPLIGQLCAGGTHLCKCALFLALNHERRSKRRNLIARHVGRGLVSEAKALGVTLEIARNPPPARCR